MTLIRKLGKGYLYVLLKTRYADINAILMLACSSIIGYPRFMSKYGYGVPDTFKFVFVVFLAIWLFCSMLEIFKRSLLKDDSMVDSIKYCLKQAIWAFLIVLTLIGYGMNYEFSKQNIWVYLIPIYFIFAVYIAKRAIPIYLRHSRKIIIQEGRAEP